MSRLEHPLSQEELMAYADGQMEAQQAVAAAQHLEVCSECSAVVNDVKRLSTQLGAWQVEDCPDAVAKRVHAKVVRYADVRKYSEPKQHWWPARRGLVYGLGGAFAVVLLLMYMIVPARKTVVLALSSAAPRVTSPGEVVFSRSLQTQQGQQG